MRHMLSLLAGVVLAPVLWVLIGLGANRYTVSVLRLDFAEGLDSRIIIGIVLLALAGLALGFLLGSHLSPLGPAVAGMAYLTISIVFLLDYAAVLNALPDGDGTLRGAYEFPVTYGIGWPLGLALLVPLVIPSRWRQQPLGPPPAAAVSPAAEPEPAWVQTRLPDPPTQHRPGWPEDRPYADEVYATGTQPRVGATGTQPRVGHTGAQPRVGATGTQPRVGATGTQPRVGATGTQSRVGSTGSHRRAGATGTQPRVGATGTQPRINATGTQPRINATGTQPRVGATGNQPRYTDDGYATGNQPRYFDDVRPASTQPRHTASQPRYVEAHYVEEAEWYEEPEPEPRWAPQPRYAIEAGPYQPDPVRDTSTGRRRHAAPPEHGDWFDPPRAGASSSKPLPWEDEHYR